MRRVIWWLRRDLRVTDNVTLHYALRDAASVVPVFILDPRLLHSDKLSPARRQFLFDSLADVDARLRERGGRLIIRRGDPARELARLVRETQSDAVYFHRDYTPYARARDTRVMDTLNALGVRVEAFDDNYLAAPEQVLKDDGAPYTIYTRFRLRFEERVIVPNRYATRGDLNTPRDITSLDLPRIEREERFARGGESEGQKLARAFFHRADGLRAYRDTRDFLARDATSHLSPHLHFGTVSVRELVRAAREADAGKQGKAWIDELVWREFYAHVLWHFPYAARGAFKREYDNIAWENDAQKFAAWCAGRTGYPIVDAGMRQLNATGWMHNRARMIVASFLTKDLLIDWRWGEKYFLQHLIDGDMASNNGGWQWSAGTGTDAQPFFRIFNPLLQGVKFDPDGAYVKQWIPELARVPREYIHAPWTMPHEIAQRARVEIGKDYPAPIVDHAIQRERALALYKRESKEKRL
ncbi:MAG: DNA photolyase family protein [Anaerolineae bacterium]|nr:DNA photolyase family protein [Anaerolineae bacterium]